MFNDSAIAIIGLAGRFPKAASVDAFWRNLDLGRECITFFTDEQLLKAGVSREDVTAPDYVKARAVLEDVDLFDAAFFGYNAREAQWMDPQQRLFLECAYTAFEHAGYPCGSEPLHAGVFAGCSVSSYLLMNLLPNTTTESGVGNMQVMIGNDKDYLATRVSYKLNLTGPSLTVQTACSTSLSAVHMACQSLLNGECEMAIAGGSCINLPQVCGYRHQEGSIASPDGHCRPFDAQAQGTNGGSGVGAVILKRLNDALADGDTIYAVIRGSAMNNDGADKVGFTAPSQNGQAAVIAEALAVSELSAHDIGYIEAHGTATRVGDPIEVAALTEVFRQATDDRAFCAIGSVKANMGHLDAAAGIAGLLRAVMALHHRRIPASINFQTPNPKIDLANSPFYVPTESLDWASSENKPRCAGVSSFGIGGTNVHVVLQEYVATEKPKLQRQELLVLSARSPQALSALRLELAQYLQENPSTNLADVAHTLRVGRNAFAYRSAIVATDLEDAIGQLRLPVQAVPARMNQVGFLYTGQGVNLLNVGRELYQTHAIFRQAIERCSEIAEPELGLSLAQTLYPDDSAQQQAQQALSDTAVAQPALVALEYAMTCVLKHHGVAPRALAGHSLGQYTGAITAGVFDIEPALKLICKRGALMQGLPDGAMTSARVNSEQASQYQAQFEVDLAAANGGEAHVFAGQASAIEALEAALQADGLAYQRLPVNRAFHSRMLDPCLDALTEALAASTPRPGHIALACNVSGQWLENDQATDPQYWRRHTREPVRFVEVIHTLSEQPELQLLEVGPAKVLTGLAQRALPNPGAQTVLTFTADSHAALLGCLGQLWQAGIAIDWSKLHEDNPPLHRIGLPTYPFERQRYWIDAPVPSALNQPAAATAQAFDVIRDGLAVPHWIEVTTQRQTRGFEHVIVVRTSGCKRSQQIVDALQARQIKVTVIEQMDELRAALSQRWDALLYATPLGHDTTIFGDRALEQSFYGLMEVATVLVRHPQEQPKPLIILSTASANVVSGDRVDPFQGSVFGAARELGVELTWLDTRCIDIAADIPAQEVIDEVLAREFSFAVALRGSQRFESKLRHCTLDSGANALPLKQHGVYWVIGGTGGVGLVIAQELARNYQARLILSSRNAGKIVNAIESVPEQWLSAQISALESEANITPIIKCGNLAPDLERYCASLVHEYFSTSGLLDDLNRTVSQNDLRNALKVQPQYAKFIDFMIKRLVDSQLAQTSQTDITFAAPGEPSASLKRELLANYPAFAGMVQFIDYCAQHYQTVLSGQRSGVSVLYPDGSVEKMSQAVATTAAHSLMAPLVQACAKLIKELVDQSPERRLRILEVGAGHGILTEAVLNEVGDIDYYFTDIGKSFVEQRNNLARQADEQRLICQTLDISLDPRTQGFSPADFDVVLAMNVVHATPDIRQTLDHLNLLLKPGGCIVLLESIKQEPWVDMVWGLTPGWWAFTDDALRSQSPLLAPSVWHEALSSCGFVDFYSSAAGQPDHDTALMVARRDPDPQGQRARFDATTKALESLGAQVLLLDADVADLEAMRHGWREATSRFGPINGVIHSGMVLEDSLIGKKTRQQASRVMQVKAIGTRVLDELCAQSPVDFVALFSSLSAYDPGPGQFDYAGANAVMDSYAQSQRGGPKRVVSINWNRWRDTGYVARLQRLHRSNGERPVRRIELDAHKDWTLSEHRINQIPLLPGTALIEHVVNAALDSGLRYPLDLTHLQYLAPCSVAPGQRQAIGVFLKDEAQASAREFEVSRLDMSEPTCYARGFLAQATQTEAPHHDLTRWQSRCTGRNHLSVSADAPLAQLGARWDCLKSMGFSDDGSQAIAHICLDPARVTDLQKHPLHPALLDVATGFACIGAYLPFSISRLTIRDQLPAQFFSLASISSEGDSPRLDVCLVDDQGQEIVKVEGYLLRAPRTRYVLEQQQVGQLDTIALKPQAARELEPDEVEIEVLAAGLNFKDVLMAAGLFGLDLPEGAALQFGAECAGRISRLGQDAQHHWHVGQEVLASATAAIAQYTTAPSKHVYIKPTELTFAQAATLPVAFTTAYYALHVLGQIKRGQRVLIHNATGGVGLAAVELAQLAGAEIFATAGSQSKRDYLRTLGVTHVMDSRTLEFSEQIMQITNHAGVDLAISALAGQALIATLQTLAIDGRLIDLGHQDSQSTSSLPLKLFERGIGYFTLNLTPEHPAYRQALNAVIDLIRGGQLKALPCKVYALSQATEAFEFMLGSKHIGKIVLAPNEAAALEHGSVQTVNPPVTGADPESGVSNEQGWNIFKLALQSNEPQIAVLSDDRLLTEPQQDTAPKEPLIETGSGSSPQRSASGATDQRWHNATQQILAGIWQDALGQEITHPDAHFFELRGDSLLAISVLAKVRQRFGIALEASTLFSAPTIAQLAQIIDQRSTPAQSVALEQPLALAKPADLTVDLTVDLPVELPPGVVAIHPGGGGKALFLTPPIMGTLFPYIELAQHIGQHRPVYGLLPRVDDKGAPRWKTIEEQAAFYVHDMMAVQPKGPYLLAGWSFGATVGFEVARQLQKRGQKVALFAAIDYPAQGPSKSGFLDFVQFFGLSTIKSLGSYTRDYFYLRGKAQGTKQSSFMRTVVEKAVISKVISPQAQELLNAERAMPEMMRIYRANAYALSKYQPSRTYRGPIDLFKTPDHDMKRHSDCLQWDEATTGRVIVHRVGGTHMTIMRSPHVVKLATLLNARLNEAEAAHRTPSISKELAHDR